MLERKHYTLNPLPVAAEILGLDMSALGEEQLQKDLYADWLGHGVLIFRDTYVDNAQHIQLSRCFGDLEMHPLPEMRNEEEPFLMELGADKKGKAWVYDGGKLRVDRVAWHRDTAYTVEICKGAVARLVDRPPDDGFTDFCDTALAYDEAPAALKQRIERLESKATLVLDQMLMKRGVTWSTIRPATEEEAPGGTAHNVPLDAVARYPSVVHPLVVTHPESGRKCIYVSPTYLDCIVGLPEDESEALMDEVVDHLLSPRFLYRHQWRDGDIVVWDNRRMLHAATGYHPKYRRRLLRTTLSGSMKTGRFYDRALEAERKAKATAEQAA